MEEGSITELLETRRADLRRELERLTAPPEQGVGVGFGKRVGDGTTEAVERLATTAAARAIHRSLLDVERALQRVAEGTYGFCEQCGAKIPEARMEALPATTRCVACAAG